MEILTFSLVSRKFLAVRNIALYSVNQQRIGHQILASLKMMVLSRMFLPVPCELSGTRKLIRNFKISRTTLFDLIHVQLLLQISSLQFPKSCSS